MLRSEARQILHVAPHATAEEIRVAYRSAIKQCHPDVGGDPVEFARAVAAHELLTAEPSIRFVRTPRRWEAAISRLRRLTTRSRPRRVH